jgi:hypothetical protein
LGPIGTLRHRINGLYLSVLKTHRIRTVALALLAGSLLAYEEDHAAFAIESAPELVEACARGEGEGPLRALDAAYGESWGLGHRP